MKRREARWAALRRSGPSFLVYSRINPHRAPAARPEAAQLRLRPTAWPESSQGSAPSPAGNRSGFGGAMARRRADSFPHLLEVRKTDGRTGVFALVDIPAGVLAARLQGSHSGHPTRHTIQISDSLHLDLRGTLPVEINPSCAPSGYVDSSDPSQPTIRALRFIERGSEITIDYCASEDVLAEPFECRCSFAGCYGVVRGYSFLTSDQRRALGEKASSFLLRKYGVPGESRVAPPAANPFSPATLCNSRGS